MPPTAEKIKDKSPFDVYAMLSIMCFLFTGGAVFMLHDDLSTNWNYGKEHPPTKAVRITQINEAPGDYPEYFNILKEDLAEWKLCAEEGAQFPYSDFEWPVGYDPLKNPVKGNQNNLEKIPADQLNALMSAHRPEGAAATPAPAPAPATPEATPPAPAPAPEGKTPKDPKEEGK